MPSKSEQLGKEIMLNLHTKLKKKSFSDKVHTSSDRNNPVDPTELDES